MLKEDMVWADAVVAPKLEILVAPFESNVVWEGAGGKVTPVSSSACADGTPKLSNSLLQFRK